MELAMARLSEMLSQAYDSGYVGSDDLRDEVVSDILVKFDVADKGDEEPPKAKLEENRVYTVAELLQMPDNTVFVHSTLGKGKIQKHGNDRYMLFDHPGLEPAGFNVDSYPWNLPMKRLP